MGRPSRTARDMTSATLGYEFNLPVGRRGELADAFFLRYQPRLALENQPSGSTFALLVKAHARRAAEFAPLSKISGP